MLLHAWQVDTYLGRHLLPSCQDLNFNFVPFQPDIYFYQAKTHLLFYPRDSLPSSRSGTMAPRKKKEKDEKEPGDSGEFLSSGHSSSQSRPGSVDDIDE